MSMNFVPYGSAYAPIRQMAAEPGARFQGRHIAPIAEAPG